MAIDALSLKQAVPAYEVNTGLKTVDKVWEEWDQGLISGPDGFRSPSIRHLEHTYKTAWRKSNASSNRFARRKVIAERIEKAAHNLKLPASLVAHRLELWRTAKGYSIDKLQKLFPKNPEPWGKDDIELQYIC